MSRNPPLLTVLSKKLMKNMRSFTNFLRGTLRSDDFSYLTEVIESHFITVRSKEKDNQIP